MSENINHTPPEEGFVAPFAADEESPYIFISYAHDDRDRVFPIITRLYEQGWKIWYDEGLQIGEDYFEQLEAHIDNSAAVILFVTHKSVERTFVTRSEVQYAVNDANKRIVLCYLDEEAKLPAGIKMALADRIFYPRTDDSNLESVLKTIEGLSKGHSRVAKGIRLKQTGIITSQETSVYEWSKVTDGVKLTRYLGSKKRVKIPAEYPRGSGQRVVELLGTFSGNDEILAVHIPRSVKRIGMNTFDCPLLKNLYIPPDVINIDWAAIPTNSKVTIHCVQGSSAHKYADEWYKTKVFDYDLSSTPIILDKNINSTENNKYAYCSYSSSESRLVSGIIQKLSEYGCILCDGGRISETEKLYKMRESRCFVVFLSPQYARTHSIEEFRYANQLKKDIIICVLEDCDLPSDLSFLYNSKQHINYHGKDKKEVLDRIINWLTDNECRHVDSDIPDFEYRATENGIVLTKYTGNSSDVTIKKEHRGVPVIGIGEYAFENCKQLVSVYIHEGIVAIGNNPFVNCIKLKRIKVHTDNAVYEDIDGVLIDKKQKMIVSCPCTKKQTYIIPDGIISIGDAAFSDCRKLKSVYIPESVTCIGNEAFKRCNRLVSISIPDSVWSIGKGAFLFCSRLRKVSLSKSITRINAETFWCCRSLFSINIPEKVHIIDDRAFDGCSILHNISLPKNASSFGEFAFGDCILLTSLTIYGKVSVFDRYVFTGCRFLTIRCEKDSDAWKYCKENRIFHRKL